MNKPKSSPVQADFWPDMRTPAMVVVARLAPTVAVSHCRGCGGVNGRCTCGSDRVGAEGTAVDGCALGCPMYVSGDQSKRQVFCGVVEVGTVWAVPACSPKVRKAAVIDESGGSKS